MNHSAKTSLKETVVRGISKSIEADSPGFAEGINRFEIHVQNVSPLDWLMDQSCHQKLYFSSRDNTFETAAIGTAKEISEQNSTTLQDALNYENKTAKPSLHIMSKPAVKINPPS